MKKLIGIAVVCLGVTGLLAGCSSPESSSNPSTSSTGQSSPPSSVASQSCPSSDEARTAYNDWVAMRQKQNLSANPLNPQAKIGPCKPASSALAQNKGKECTCVIEDQGSNTFAQEPDGHWTLQ